MVRHRSKKLFLIASAAMLIAQPQASGQLVGRHHHEHHIGNVSCAVGNCPTNVLTYGYFRENWRRWPEQTPEPQSRALTPFVIPDRVPFKPIVPDARDEASQRTRNRQPIQARPEDAGTGSSPQSSAPSTNNSQQTLDFGSLPDDTTPPGTTAPDATLPGDISDPATETTPAPADESTTPATDDDIFSSPDPLPESPAETEEEDEFDLDLLDLGEKSERGDRVASLNEQDGNESNVRTISAEVEIATTAPATASSSADGSAQIAPTQTQQPAHPAASRTPQQGQLLHPSQSIQQQPVAAHPQAPVARPTTLVVQPHPYIGQPLATAVQPQRFVGQPVATGVHPQAYVGQPVTTGVHPQAYVGQPVAAGVHPQAYVGQPVTAGVHPQGYVGQPVAAGVHAQAYPGQPATAFAHPATAATGQPSQLTTVNARPLGQVHHQVTQYDPRHNPLRFQGASGTAEPAVHPPTQNQPTAVAPAAELTTVEKVTVEIQEEPRKTERPRPTSGRRNPLRQR